MNEPENFEPIETFEEFESAMKSHIDAAVADAEKRFEGWISPEDVAAIIKERDDGKAALEALTEENRAYEINSEKIRIALELGIPFELAEKLSGETEKEIRADAEKMLKFLVRTPQQLPKFSAEPPVKSTHQAAYLSMLQTIYLQQNLSKNFLYRFIILKFLYREKEAGVH